MAMANESITDVFERFNKLINDLQIHNIYYEIKELNLKFLVTLPGRLESKISAIGKKDCDGPRPGVRGLTSTHLQPVNIKEINLQHT